MDIAEMVRLGIPNMTQAEMLKYFPYNAPVENQVLDSLVGNLIPECRLPWVENIFVPGHPCHEAYHKMHVAYSRLRERLHETDEDPDAEEMINYLLEYSNIIALKMFAYGRIYQQQYVREVVPQK